MPLWLVFYRSPGCRQSLDTASAQDGTTHGIERHLSVVLLLCLIIQVAAINAGGELHRLPLDLTHSAFGLLGVIQRRLIVSIDAQAFLVDSHAQVIALIHDL